MERQRGGNRETERGREGNFEDLGYKLLGTTIGTVCGTKTKTEYFCTRQSLCWAFSINICPVAQSPASIEGCNAVAISPLCSLSITPKAFLYLLPPLLWPFSGTVKASGPGEGGQREQGGLGREDRGEQGGVERKGRGEQGAVERKGRGNRKCPFASTAAAIEMIWPSLKCSLF